jgi:glycosyltransferase involved in cell wall biosynthesis
MSESTAHDKVRSWWVESLKGDLVRLFSAALVGGSAHREYLLQLGFPESRIFQGYDVVDNNYFSRGASDVRSAPASRCQVEVQEPFFLACSRFSEKKNLARLIEAYALYRGSCNGKYWKLVILGEGELRGELESFRDRLGLSADVVMPGAKSYQDLPLYYGLASAFVHASTSEQWGLVVNEAMASGLPVLVSERCGCAPDLVTPRNGFTFDPTNVEALSGLMLRVSNGQCDLQRMGQASQEIISRWSPQTFAENLQAATRSATTGPPRRTRLHRCLPLLER